MQYKVLFSPWFGIQKRCSQKRAALSALELRVAVFLCNTEGWEGRLAESAKMCPLRVLLLFLSAILAGYFAFKSVRSDGDSSIFNLSEDEPEQATEETGLLTKVSTGISSGFWVMVDMLSGRYLYKNLKGQTQTQVKGAEVSSRKGLAKD